MQETTQTHHHLNVIKNQNVNRMKSSQIKKIRNVIIFLVSIIVFFGAQNVPASSSGETQSFLYSLAMSVIMFFVQYVFSSDYMYNSLQENGLYINYNFFQIISLLIILFMLYIVTSAYIWS